MDLSNTSDLIVGKRSQWLEALLYYLPNLAVSLIVWPYSCTWPGSSEDSFEWPWRRTPSMRP